MTEHPLPLWAGIGLMLAVSLLVGVWWAFIVWAAGRRSR